MRDTTVPSLIILIDCGVGLSMLRMSEAKSSTNAVDHDVSETASKSQSRRAGVIKNKFKRQLLYRREKLLKAKEKRERKESRKRQAKQLGEEVRKL